MPFFLLVAFMFLLGLLGKRSSRGTYAAVAAAACLASYLALR